jgi:hypothetical protein
VKELGVKPSKMIAGHLQNHEDTWQSLWTAVNLGPRPKRVFL